jgi:enterochelin esterase family protein
MKILTLNFTVLFILQLFSLNIYGQSSVTIHDDKTVTFQIHALYANSVYVEGLGGVMGGNHYMNLSPEGIWEVTTPPLEAGFHYYQLVIDSVAVNFPGQPTYFGWGQETSGLEIPDDNLDFYLPNKVPHGDVSAKWYHSKVTNTIRNALVYTPPGYHSDLNLRFPVLYLQHGAGESEMAWVYQGKVNFILDNLISSGLAIPMIVVMDNGYAAKPGAENPKRPSHRDNDFDKLMLNELIPIIDRNFRTLKNKRYRAIAGLSMGGGQAIQIGFKNLDMFGSIGVLSAYPWRFDMKAIYKDYDLNEELELLWLGYGKDDRSHKNGLRFHEELKKERIDHIWYECDGGHVWQVWRKHFYDLATHLFK